MDVTKKVVIMVTGSYAKPDNHKECEKTWIPLLRKMGFKVLIALGNKEVQKYGVLTPNDFKNYYKFLDENTIEFRLRHFIIYSCCPSKSRLRSNYDLIQKYSEKIYAKFDVFYYLKELRKLDFCNEALFNDQQQRLFNTVSNKSYRVWYGKKIEDYKFFKFMSKFC